MAQALLAFAIVTTPVQQRILVTQAEPGMVLARPVILPSKLVLCAEGSVLTEPIIIRIMARGVKRIAVVGRHAPDVMRDDYATAMAKLKTRFTRVHQVPFMAGIEQVIARVLARRMS